MTEGEADSSSENEITQQRLRVSNADQSQDRVFTRIVFGLIRRAGSVGRLIDDGIYFIEQMWHRRSSQAGISGKCCCGALLDREKERRTASFLPWNSRTRRRYRDFHLLLLSMAAPLMTLERMERDLCTYLCLLIVSQMSPNS